MRPARGQAILAALVLAVSALSAVAAVQFAAPQPRGDPRWREIAWSFPRDGWPAGRAFRCAACGQGVELYVRPKIGFCNCDTGVADDDEVDRVADLDLISPRFAPSEPGAVVRVAGLTGRARHYRLTMADGSQRQALGIALSRRCDLFVAVAQGRAARPDLERAAYEFLGSDDLHRWILASLGAR